MKRKNTRIDYFTILIENISKYQDKGKIILCGDFNSRIGNLIDLISNDEQDPNFDSLFVDNQHSTHGVSKIVLLTPLVAS